ncbi:DUF1642 domain-containing protein [Streptococcus parasanguinis]|uniref:DUF1642 domain-containing protein n=1 Tax=Streptococcus parasanguinis TaxID=1318 RepID=UPI001011ED00|nr:DUF1642 domain-containing protein [Streptococcus parasanguinis]MBK5057855.1 DUF1642 domain-containing protein [Streptococcus parasanguinis]RXX16494.1 hypothetical protein DF218_10425 [Streptococcus parasanguinis]
MNKQELIERIKGLKNLFGNKAEYIEIDAAIKLIEQLNEPQKTVVPQFVADYIKYAIENDWDFQDLFKCIEDEEDEELLRWVYHERNQETLAAAWINGYTVEKEKRYLVKMKNLRALFCYLAYILDEGYWTFMASGGESIVIKHTRKELEKAGFGEVFNSPLFEIEEVEE